MESSRTADQWVHIQLTEMTTETETAKEPENIPLNMADHVPTRKRILVTTVTVGKEAIPAMAGTITETRTGQAREEVIHPKEKIHTVATEQVHKEKTHTEDMSQALREEAPVRGLNILRTSHAGIMVPILPVELHKTETVLHMEEMKTVHAEILRKILKEDMKHVGTVIQDLQELPHAVEETHPTEETETSQNNQIQRANCPLNLFYF
jgi:hypothetical protein